ncbi:MAG: glutamine--fructose-6-phosphate aminotransferase, partial [Desulfobacterales bacterium]|nr:glutamine--fructose-6-phosphate aminotransferase [Desulfobacterales bacterium]
MRTFFSKIGYYLSAGVYFGKDPANVSCRSFIFFPCRKNVLCCGLAGIVSFKKEKKKSQAADITPIEDSIGKIEDHTFNLCIKNNFPIHDNYLCGGEIIRALLESAGELKRDEPFFEIFINNKLQENLAALSERINRIIDSESKILSGQMGRLEPSDVEVMSNRIEDLKDIAWLLKNEIGQNIIRIKELLGLSGNNPSFSTLALYKKINAVLNSIDRLEVRGRDSAGISMIFVLDASEYGSFEKIIGEENLTGILKDRSSSDILLNGGITIGKRTGKNGKPLVTAAFVYKIAAEIGSLGDNIAFLRKQIQADRIFGILASFPCCYNTVSSHTRWASVGAITEANCHPVDGSGKGENGIIHVCLNGDIDNYIELKKEYESGGNFIHSEISTDTKIIPLQIEKYLGSGFDVEESFRLAVNDFEGSHAISMHTDLDPGRIFLAQRGSGQAIFIGIGKDHFIPASEVYGFIEETPYYLKLEGDKANGGNNGNTRGQIYILSQESQGGLSGIKAISYDGTHVLIEEKDI